MSNIEQQREAPSEMQRSARIEADKEIAARKLTEEALRKEQTKLEVDSGARNTQLHQLSVKLMNFHGEERRRIARDLHDSAGQYFAGIQMNLSALLGQVSASTAPAISRIPRLKRDHGRTPGRNYASVPYESVMAENSFDSAVGSILMRRFASSDARLLSPVHLVSLSSRLPPGPAAHQRSAFWNK